MAICTDAADLEVTGTHSLPCVTPDGAVSCTYLLVKCAGVIWASVDLPALPTVSVIEDALKKIDAPSSGKAFVVVDTTDLVVTAERDMLKINLGSMRPPVADLEALLAATGAAMTTAFPGKTSPFIYLLFITVLRYTYH